MKSITLSVVVLSLAGIAPAGAQVLVDHQPYPLGGPGSDTAVPISQFPFTWQLSADDFRVSVSGTVAHVNWWGFYFETIAPPSESMRMRLYDSRLSDGLPGNMLFEESFQNPERIETGRTIALPGSPREYRYHVQLAKGFDLNPGVVYWLEIVQVGDLNSGFRWEFALAEQNGHAYVNNLVSDWQLPPTNNGDLAFQLIVPEPMTGALLIIGLAVAAGLRARGRLNRG